jgi:hypothetical protein
MAIVKILKFLRGKSQGSLIPLSFGFFLISLSILFISININAAYASKKELINLGEGAIQRAAHEIDLFSYYLELNRFSSNKRVPINCIAARSKFVDLISNSQISGHDVNIESFDCSLFEISAKISIYGKMPVQVPILGSLNNEKFMITATVGANSPYQLS